jgi:hypothetical protein
MRDQVTSKWIDHAPGLGTLSFILFVIADSTVRSNGPATVRHVAPTLQSQSHLAMSCEATRVAHNNGRYR